MQMSSRRSRIRPWLVFAGIVILILSLSLLRIRFLMAMGRLGIPVALTGVLLILLGRRSWKKGDVENR